MAAEGTAARALEVRSNGDLVGWLRERESLWSFEYSANWCAGAASFNLSPALDRRQAMHIDGASERPVQWYFDNLLPEEDLLRVLAKEARLPVEDAFGLLAYYGAESAGSLVLAPAATPDAPRGVRALAPSALQGRIERLPDAPLTREAPKRMSLAGAQHKMVVLARDSGGIEPPTLFEPLPGTASTHILKPESPSAHYPLSVANETFTMRLAQAMGLQVPRVWRLFVPAPVYLVERFDRRLIGPWRDEQGPEVERVHQIDTCQLLNRSRLFKYSQADLISLRAAIAHCRSKARARLQLLRWLLFNVLVGNGDNHLKNLSFTVSARGIELAPAYDLLCTAVYDTRLYAQTPVWPRSELALGLTQGDGRAVTHFEQVRPEHLVAAGEALGLARSTVERELQRMVSGIGPQADALIAATELELKAVASAVQRGGEMQMLRAIRHTVIGDLCRQLQA